MANHDQPAGQPAESNEEIVQTETNAIIGSGGGESVAENLAEIKESLSEPTVDELTNDYSLEELNQILDTGKLPDKTADKKPDTGTEDKPATLEAATDKPDIADDKKEDKTDDATVPEPFKFTENADPETFAKEEAAFWEQYEKTPEIDALLSFRDNRIAALETQVAEVKPVDEDTTDHMVAFDTLVRTKYDPELQIQVPDTSGLVSLLEKKYPVELPRLIEDLNAQSSPKYPGLMRFQQYIKDAFDLTPQAMQDLNYFLQNKGQMPIPAYVPLGVDVKVADAYWSAPDRMEMQRQIEAAAYTIQSDADATETEKEAARESLRAINSRLQREQAGLDATKQTRDATAVQAQKERQEIFATGEKAFYETSTGLLSQFSDRIAKALPMYDAAGSGLTGLSVATLVEKALTDDKYHSKFAQDRIKAMGIDFDFKRGRAALDDLWETELLIAAQTKQGFNERAVRMSQQKKHEIIKQLENLETELSGKIVARVVTGNAAQMAKKMAVAPKALPVKPRASGAPVTSTATPNYDDMTLEEINKEVAKLTPEALYQSYQ